MARLPFRTHGHTDARWTGVDHRGRTFRLYGKPLPHGALRSGYGNVEGTERMTANRTHHTATLLPNGEVLIAGGLAGSSDLASAEIYAPPAKGTWSPISS